MAIHKKLHRRDRDLYLRASAARDHPFWSEAIDAEMKTEGAGVEVVISAFATGPPPRLEVVKGTG